jgi:hypothetical protein
MLLVVFRGSLVSIYILNIDVILNREETTSISERDMDKKT